MEYTSNTVKASKSISTTGRICINNYGYNDHTTTKNVRINSNYKNPQTTINLSPCGGTSVSSSISSISPLAYKANKKKQQQKLHKLLHKEQLVSSNRRMLTMILSMYIGIVTSIFIIYISIQPTQFQSILTQSSFINATIETIVQGDVSSRDTKGSNHHQLNRRRGTTGTTVKDKNKNEQYRYDENDTNALPNFLFQKGQVLGVEFLQCCTIHGFVNAAQERYENDAINGGIPNGGIVMPQSTYSNDIVILGRQYFRSPIPRNLKHGADLVIDESDIEHRALYEYCVTSEQRYGLVDSITILDLSHPISTLFLTNIMKELLRMKRISALPIAALITPEQSSQTIIDWMMYGEDHTQLLNLARHWIPISAGPYIQQAILDDQYPTITMTDSLDQSSASLPSSSIFRQVNQWPILVISCDDDMVSRNAAESLRTEHSLTTHSMISGNKSCYLHTPTIFITVVLDYFVYWEHHYPTAATTKHTYDAFQDNIFANDNMDTINGCSNTYTSEIFPI
jgi:hypothetical protein